MIKVVHIITKMEVGGAQKNTLYTIENLDPERFETELWSGFGGAMHIRPSEWIFTLDRPINPFNDLFALFHIYNNLRKDKPDIVHTHSSKAGILGRIAAWLARVPVIIHTYHGFGFNDYQKPWTRWFFIQLEKLSAKITNILVFVSVTDLRKASELGINQSCVLIRSGIEFKDIPSSRGIKPIVATITNFKLQKNFGDFLKVTELVHQQIPEIEFWVIGERDNLAGYMAGKYPSYIKFLGHREDVQELLSQTHVFVLTSLWEGLPQSLLQAMRQGCVPVVYDVGGCRDVINDFENGCLIPLTKQEHPMEPSSADNMATTIIQLLEWKENLKEMSKKAKTSIGPEFNQDEMVKQLEELYEEEMSRVTNN